MVAKRGSTNQKRIKSFKAQRCRIPIDPTILAAIENKKMKPETVDFCFWPEVDMYSSLVQIQGGYFFDNKSPK